MRTRLFFLTAAVVPAALAPTAVAAPTAKVRCVAPNPSGAGKIAYFGYSNPDAAKSDYPVGPLNGFATVPVDAGFPQNQGQPTTFYPDAPQVGTYGDTQTQLAVAVPFTGTGVGWKIDGTPRATATTSSDACAFDVAIALTPDRAAAGPGDTINWKATLTNAGTTPFPWRGVTIGGTGGPTIGSPLAPVPDELMAGESMELAAGKSTVTSDACFSSVSGRLNATIITPLIKNPEVTLANNVSERSVAVNCSVDLQVAAPFDKASYVPGETARRTATVSNVGQAPVPLSAVAVNDTALGTYTLAPGSPAVLAPGATATYSAAKVIPAEASQCGATLLGTTTVAVGDASGRYVDDDVISNSWTGSATVAGGICIPVVTQTATTQKAPTPPPAPARIAASITAPPTVRQGDRGNVRVVVTNNRNTPMTNVAVAISVPRRVIIAQKLQRGDVRTGNSVWRRIGNLAPGRSWSVSLKVRFPVGYLGTRRTLVRVFANASAPVRSVVVTKVKP